MSRNILLAALSAAIILPSITSCKIDPSGTDFMSTVTLKNCDDGSYYYKETELTALVPQNPGTTPVQGFKEKRMIIRYCATGKAPEKEIPGFDNTFLVDVTARTQCATYATVPSLGSEEKDKAYYGGDPVSLYFYGEGKFPFTTLEDGYLCVYLEYISEPESGYKHTFDLVTGANPDDPWEVELRHKAFGPATGEVQSAYMVFPLNQLEDTKGEDKTLTLIWNNGQASEKLKAKFKFRTRTDWPEVFPYEQ